MRSNYHQVGSPTSSNQRKYRTFKASNVVRRNTTVNQMLDIGHDDPSSDLKQRLLRRSQSPLYNATKSVIKQNLGFRTSKHRKGKDDYEFILDTHLHEDEPELTHKLKEENKIQKRNEF